MEYPHIQFPVGRTGRRQRLLQSGIGCRDWNRRRLRAPVCGHAETLLRCAGNDFNDSTKNRGRFANSASVSRLVVPCGRPTSVQLQRFGIGVGVSHANRFVQSTVGTWRRCFTVTRRLRDNVPAKNSSFRLEHGPGGASVSEKHFLTLYRWYLKLCWPRCNARYLKWTYVFSIDFPREVVRGESLFTNMVIDATTSSPANNCDDVFIYITDTVEPGRNSWTKISRFSRLKSIPTSALQQSSFMTAVVIWRGAYRIRQCSPIPTLRNRTFWVNDSRSWTASLDLRSMLISVLFTSNRWLLTGNLWYINRVHDAHSMRLHIT